MSVLPATGSEIVMGRVRTAYNNVAAGASQNISLSGTLGGFIGQGAGTQLSLSSRFGGRLAPYLY